MSGTAATDPGRLRVLRAVTHGRRRYVLAAAMLTTLASGATIVLPLAVRELVAAISDTGSILPATLAMTALALVGALCSGGSATLLAYATESMVRDVRRSIIGRTLRLPIPAVRSRGSGDLVTRTVTDAANLRSVVELGLVQFPAAVVQTVLTVVVMALLDPVLLGVTVGCLGVAGGGVAAMLVGVRQHANRQQSVLGRLATSLTAAIDALPVIKSNRAEELVAAQLDSPTTEAMNAARSMGRLQALMAPAVQLGQQVALVGVVLASGVRISTGALAIPDFAAFLLYLLQLMGPLTVLAIGAGRLQTGLAARRRVDEVLELAPEPSGTARPVPGAAPALDVADADVDHPDGAPALRGIAVRVPRTGMTAVVGPSGAGKSTLLGAIGRLTAPHHGSIRLHGVDVADWDLDALRREVSVVDQDCTLLRGTVRENLVPGDPDPPPDERLYAALAEVGLADEIVALPDGLDTELGSGLELAGGQRQRLTIARAVLRGSGVVLLDEPTSALDGANESHLRDVLGALAQRCCVVVVAHRLSTVRDADRILVLDGGRVAGLGTHRELLDDCSVYRELVAGQLLRTWQEPDAIADRLDKTLEKHNT